MRNQDLRNSAITEMPVYGMIVKIKWFDPSWKRDHRTFSPFYQDLLDKERDRRIESKTISTPIRIAYIPTVNRVAAYRDLGNYQYGVVDFPLVEMTALTPEREDRAARILYRMHVKKCEKAVAEAVDKRYRITETDGHKKMVHRAMKRPPIKAPSALPGAILKRRTVAD